MTFVGDYDRMLLYDWKKILNKSGNSSKRVLIILESMISTRMPRNRFDPIYRYQGLDFSGHSFLVNPFPLISERYKWKDKELADYIGLASFRNLGEYLVSGKLTLDLSHSPVGQDALNNNRLLHIKNKQIHFLYEDYKEKKLWQV